MQAKSPIKELGVMLDCSRNGIMTVESVKKFIDLIAKMGYNQLFLHMENTYEVEGEPYFGYLRGRYSMAELTEIEEYGYQHGVELVPLTQTLAHMSSLLQWPQYRAFSDDADTMLVGDERTYALIDKMYASLRKALPRARYLHTSMDEAHNLGNGKYRDLHGDVPKIDIMVEHINRVCEIAKKYNFKPMIWYTTLYSAMHGHKSTSHYFWPNYPEGENFDETLAARLPKDIIIGYGNYNEHRKESAQMRLACRFKWCARLAGGMENVMHISGAWKWSTFAPRNLLSTTNAYYTAKAAFETGLTRLVVGLWGDNGNEASSYSVLPTLVYTACVAQGIFDKEEICQKFREWVGGEIDDFMLLDLPEYTPDYMLGMPNTPAKYQLYNDCFLGKLDKMVAPFDTANYAKYAEQIADAGARAGEYKYVFDTLAALCSVLALKADIGIRSRKVYREGTREELDKLIADYHEMIKRMEHFYACHRIQWDKENKPHGYEVQDIRMGGLIGRMRHCCRRLEDYRDGKLDRIMELEDDILEYLQFDNLPYSDARREDSVKKYPLERWLDIISTNNL
ncbi:MAG: family 20 glycosylhydrolase [Clostridia bacterium]|nr:family 20 glycosylhydrolase [Clostridia bacterium]